MEERNTFIFAKHGIAAAAAAAGKYMLTLEEVKAAAQQTSFPDVAARLDRSSRVLRQCVCPLCNPEDSYQPPDFWGS